MPAPRSAMRYLAWNCRGLGSPHAVRALRELIKKEDPHVVFLSETKLHVNKLEKIKNLCGMKNCFGVNAEGRSGGLVML